MTCFCSVTCHIGSHSVTCHPTQVNTTCLHFSQTGRYSTYQPWGIEGWVNLRGAFKKFCNSIWCTNDTSKIFMLLFNIITLNTNAYVKSVKKLLYASQIELWWPAVQIRLSTQWTAWSHCHRGTTSSDDKTGRRHWVL